MYSTKILSKVFLGSMLLVGTFTFAAPAHAALTSAQVSAVISLLQSFNVDQATITKVWMSLVGAGTPATGSVSFFAGAEPADASVAPAAQNVPFTTFTLVNNTASAVTVSGVVVARGGSASDSTLGSVGLVDSAGIQVGAGKTLDPTHQATLGSTFVLNPGQVKTLTVVGTIAPKGKAHNGQNVSLAVVAINTSAALYGSLPLAGATYTVSTSLKPSTSQY